MKRRFVFALSSIFLVSFILWACAPFQDSVFSDSLLRKERQLNHKMIDLMGDMNSDGIVRIAVIADSHQNYKPLDQTIDAINDTPGIDFVANLGDFTNSAYNLEYDQFLKSYARIKMPRVTTIGNHDAIGAGPSLFKKAFGDINFYFESTLHRFVFFSTANLEDPESFKPDWLSEVVNGSTKPVIIFTHIALEDTERFSGQVAPTFNQIIQKAQIVFNGHNHVYFSRERLGTTLIQGPRVEVGWIIAEIQGTSLKITQMPKGQVEWFTLKP